MAIWEKVKKIIPIVGIALFVYIILKLDIREILNQIIQADLLYLLLTVLLVPIFFLSQTFKWWVLARKQKINVPYLEALRINIITDFYGFVTPSKVGSILRANYLKKYAGGLAKGTFNFVLDKIFDLISVLFLAIVFGLIFQKKFGLGSIQYLITLFLLLILGILIIIDKEKSKVFLGFFYRKIIPEKIKEKLRPSINGIYEYIPKEGTLVLVFLMNAITWVILYLVTYFVGISLGIDISFVYYLAILPIATLIAQIPITISGFGTREAMMIYLFGLFGVAAAKVFSMSLLTIVIMSVIPAFVAIILLLIERK